MPAAPFTTARLRVTPWDPAQADPARRAALEAGLARILTAPVLAPLPPSLQLSAPGDVAAWLDARTAESTLLPVQQNGALVGLMILADDPAATPRPALHIGYLLAEAVWGQGLASELLAGFVAAKAGDGPLDLVAGVDRSNPASARVLEKAGFVRAPDRATPETDVYVFPIDGAPQP